MCPRVKFQDPAAADRGNCPHFGDTLSLSLLTLSWTLLVWKELYGHQSIVTAIALVGHRRRQSARLLGARKQSIFQSRFPVNCHQKEAWGQYIEPKKRGRTAWHLLLQRMFRNHSQIVVAFEDINGRTSSVVSSNASSNTSEHVLRLESDTNNTYEIPRNALSVRSSAVSNILPPRSDVKTTLTEIHWQSSSLI